jgi:hypothetical protein
MTDWRLFWKLLWAKWEKAMTGSLIVAFILAVGGTIWQGVAYLAIFFVALAVCLFLAAYRVWRDEYHAARPYVEQTYIYAKGVFALLPEAKKAALKITS